MWSYTYLTNLHVLKCVYTMTTEKESIQKWTSFPVRPSKRQRTTRGWTADILCFLNFTRIAPERFYITRTKQQTPNTANSKRKKKTNKKLNTSEYMRPSRRYQLSLLGYHLTKGSAVNANNPVAVKICMKIYVIRKDFTVECKISRKIFS